MNFVGIPSASKSLFNRALILKSFSPALNVIGESHADDVVKMKAALAGIGRQTVFDCGDGGTTLRFLALRLAREVGKFELVGSAKLFSRPQSELVRILNQLGVKSTLEDRKMIIESAGWKPQGDTLYVPCGTSSQFLSSVVLNSWNLPFDLFVSPENFHLSRSYFSMTRLMAEQAGMTFRNWDQDFCIFKNQEIKASEIRVEPDMSSCFSLAAVAAVSGSLVLTPFPENSIQPDVYFLDVLKAMGVPIEISPGRVRISKAPSLSGVRVNLKDSPDLFPVLAALCSFANGPSELRGAPHLKFKESSRISKIKELLNLVGCQSEEYDDGIKVIPSGGGVTGTFSSKHSVAHDPEAQATQRLQEKVPCTFNPEDDHRLAMAAGVLLKGGHEFELLNSHVVAKSFPEFWDYIGMRN